MALRKKHRRKHSEVVPRLTVSKKDFLRNNFIVDKFYDCWCFWRSDNTFGDNKKIKKAHFGKGTLVGDKVVEKRIRMNKKQKKLLNIRKLRKIKRK